MMAGASFSTAEAKTKKTLKNAPVVERPKQTVLNNGVDSLSYAAGMAMTDGLIPFLKQNYNVPDSLMGDFIKGFQEAAAMRNNGAFKAKMAGMQIAEMVEKRMLPGLKKDFGGDEAIIDSLVFDGFAASLKKDYSVYTDSAAQAKFTESRTALQEKKHEAQKKQGEDFLAANKQKEGVVTLDNGLQYKVLKEGNGPKPTADDEVEVIYEGRTIDGNVFDSTAKHGTKSDVFGVSGLIKGWTQALQMMPVGSKWELYIPYQLAYGERGAGENIKPYSALIFTLELVSIKTEKKEPAKETAKKVVPAAKLTKAQPRKTTPKKIQESIIS